MRWVSCCSGALANPTVATHHALQPRNFVHSAIQPDMGHLACSSSRLVTSTPVREGERRAAAPAVGCWPACKPARTAAKGTEEQSNYLWNGIAMNRGGRPPERQVGAVRLTSREQRDC